MKRSDLTQKVELKVTLTTIVVTVVCLLPLMALLHGLRETRGIVGLAFVSSIFCSMNNVLEQYGPSARVVRSLREKYSEEKSSNNNEQLPCNGNEIMTEAYNDCKEGDLNNSLLKTAGDSTKQDEMPISGSGRNSFAEETTMKSKQRESSINLGIFTS